MLKPEPPPRKYDVKRVIEQLMPSLLALLGSQEISWTSINKSMFAQANKLRQQLKENETTKVEVTFHFVLFKKSQGKGRADGTFDFLDKLFIYLEKDLSYKEKKSIHKMLKKVLETLDTRYLNFVAELAVLRFYTFYEGYELLNIEEPISGSNGITSDLCLKNKLTGSDLLVEVVNLRLEEKNFSNFNELERHIERKLKQKVEEKLLSPKYEMYIQPVVWYKDDNQLMQISGFFKQYTIPFEKVKEPLVLVTVQDTATRQFDHSFDWITSVGGGE